MMLIESDHPQKLKLTHRLRHHNAGVLHGKALALGTRRLRMEVTHADLEN